MSREYDIIIVGAGCAGSAAAKRLAEKGLRALVLEKARKPGEKNVSGANILGQAIAVNPSLHYLFEGPIEREISAFRFHFISGNFTNIYEGRYKDPFSFSIRRDEFDAWHADVAVRTGAELRTSTTVVDVLKEDGKIVGIVTDKGEKIRAQVVIDAGGVHSIVGRKAGLIKKRGGTDKVLYVTVNVELPERIIDERWGDTNEYYIASGITYKTWPWIFPRKDSVILGTGGYMVSELGNPNKYMEKFLKLPIVAKKLKGGKIRSWGCHCDPDSLAEKTYTDGLLLTGDAGGFVWPFIGEGMTEAFITGIYAADTAIEAIDAGDSSEKILQNYEEHWKADPYLQMVYTIGKQQKEAVLTWADEEFIDMMMNVMNNGGFTTAYIHTKWIEGAKERNIEKVLQAWDCLKAQETYKEIMDAIIPEIKKIRGLRGLK